jgi:hypothetical protein
VGKEQARVIRQRRERTARERRTAFGERFAGAARACSTSATSPGILVGAVENPADRGRVAHFEFQPCVMDGVFLKISDDAERQAAEYN